jgi:hypothetical protein
LFRARHFVSRGKSQRSPKKSAAHITAADAISAKIQVNILGFPICCSALDSGMRHEGAASGLCRVGSGVGKIWKNGVLLGILPLLAEPEGFEPSIGLYNPITV